MVGKIVYGAEYVNTPSAAHYCGYGVKHFRDMMKGYKLPKYGPKRNRYKLSDLDTWMESPNAFETHVGTRKGNFKRVE